jgi:hypothetical protein
MDRKLRGSVNQVVEKNFLDDLIVSSFELQQVLHYDKQSRRLTVEDPQYIFYIRHLPWRTFAKEIGYVNVDFSSKYDFALSFAGCDRDIAETIYNKLCECEIEVFYDKSEQFRILATNVEEYLEAIYQSEAVYVICLLGREYPRRIWTRFEAGAFKERIVRGEVIPILIDDVEPTMFDRLDKIGHHRVYRKEDLKTQIDQVVDLFKQKIFNSRFDPQMTLLTTR